MKSKLVKDLEELSFFSSVYTSRILKFLLENVGFFTAKQIHNDLGIPDSKIYPALQELEGLGIIDRQGNSRPQKYYLSDISRLMVFLEDKMDREIMQRQELLQRVIQSIERSWQPRDYEQEDIAQIIKGENLHYEIIKLFKHSKKSLFVLLAPAMIKYMDSLSRAFTDLDEQIHIYLAVPYQSEFKQYLKGIDMERFDNVKIKQSIPNTQSYIVVDNNIMLNITHNTLQDVGILTNNQLLVEYIAGCWGNEQCCTNPQNFEFIADLKVHTS